MKERYPTTILFITGTFIGHNCWDEWIIYFENRGYHCLAPAWPFKKSSPEELRNRHPDKSVAVNTLASLTDYYDALIRNMPVKPVMIGHSAGALIVQLLLSRGLGAAAVSLHPFPPSGIWHLQYFIRKMWILMLCIFSGLRKSYMISFKSWEKLIANDMPEAQLKESYYQYATPESMSVIRDAFNCKMKINFDNDHPPLLIIAGTHDRLIHSSINHAIYKKYKRGSSFTDYKNFQDRNHLVFDQLEKIEEADYVFDWLQSLRYRA